MKRGYTSYPSIDSVSGKQVIVKKSYYPISPITYYTFGFVSGCVWGDDSSWKLQYLDLSRINEGVFRREERFGYLELPDNVSLHQAIDMIDYNPTDDEFIIRITIQHHVDLRTGKTIK